MGGAERVVQTLAESLVAVGHSVTVVTAQPSATAAVREINGVQVRYVPIANVSRSIEGSNRGTIKKALWHFVDAYNWMMARAVGDILDEIRPDVVNTHNLVGLSVATMSAVKSRRIPLVHTLHDQYLLCPRSTMFKQGTNCSRQCFDCRLYAWPRRIVADSVDVVVGVSQFILDHHLDFGYFKSAETKVIYNGVGTVNQLTSRARGKSQAMRFGFLGQVRPTKGLHELIDAYISECSQCAELWVAGHGDAAYEAQLRQRTAGIQNIRWLGFVPPSELLDAIDILVVPSLWRDTAPLVVLEAAAHGVPVLGAHLGGIPEFVTAETGWTYDPNQPGDLRRGLRECLLSPSRLESMSAAGRALAARFNLQTFLTSYLNAYRAAIVRST